MFDPVLNKRKLKNIHTLAAIIALETYTTEQFLFQQDAQPIIDFEMCP